jgi:hypothetical protein
MLYSPPRLILEDPRRWSPTIDWNLLASPTRDDIFAGYFHLFNAADPVLVDKPWYDVQYTHCGGGDYYFQARWLREHRSRELGFRVLHLGPRDVNWFGRVTPRLDGAPLPPGVDERRAIMQKYAVSQGWRNGGKKTYFPEKIGDQI